MSTTTITGEDLSWLCECMERMADNDQGDAESKAGDYQLAQEHGAADLDYYADHAKWSAEDAAQTKRLYEILKGATQVDIKKEV